MASEGGERGPAPRGKGSPSAACERHLERSILPTRRRALPLAFFASHLRRPHPLPTAIPPATRARRHAACSCFPTTSADEQGGSAAGGRGRAAGETGGGGRGRIGRRAGAVAGQDESERVQADRRAARGRVAGKVKLQEVWCGGKSRELPGTLAVLGRPRRCRGTSPMAVVGVAGASVGAERSGSGAPVLLRGGGARW